MSQAVETWIELQSEKHPTMSNVYRIDRDNENETWVVWCHDTSNGQWGEGKKIMYAGDRFYGGFERSFSVIIKMLYAFTDQMQLMGWKQVEA